MQEGRFIKHPRNPVIPRDPRVPWRQALTADPALLRVGDEYRLYIRGRREVADPYHGPALVGSVFIGFFTAPPDSPGATGGLPTSALAEPQLKTLAGKPPMAPAPGAFDGAAWSEYPGNPVIEAGPPGSIDDVGLFAGDFLRVGDEYLFYCTAVSHDFGIDLDKGIRPAGKCIVALRSPDGVRFQRTSDRPLIPPMSGAGVVVEHGGEYHLFFNQMLADGSHELRVVRSADPLRFEPAAAEVALPRGRARAWDSHQVQNPRLYFEEGVWYMVYGGSDRFADNPHHVGVASSRDLREWVRYPGNPVLSRGREGEWDDCALWPGSLAKVGGTYYLWYEGRSSGEPQAAADARATGRGRGGFSQVGLATMEAEVFFFRP